MFPARHLQKLSVLILSFALVLPATALSSEEVAQLETVQVTGSRLQRTDLETATPVYVLSSDAIKAAGYQRVEDVLNSLPQVQAAQTAYISNGATLTATADLRGLGPQRTLVLFNGRRMPPGGVYTNSADINQIPAALIERVEILTGGGSTVYGADAVAGVINFILRDDFAGVEVSADWSGFQHDNRNAYIQGLMDDSGFDYPDGNSGIDGVAKSISVALGGSFAEGRGHATAYASWRSVESLLQGKRDYASCALSNSATSCGGSANAIIPNFDIYPVNFTDPDSGELVPNYDDPDMEFFATLGSDGLFHDFAGNYYNYAPINYFQRPDERYSLGAFADLEVNRHVRPYLEINFMNDRSNAQIAESGTFFAEEYIVGLDNRDVFSAAQANQLQSYYGLPPDGEVAVYVGKRNVEGGGRRNIGSHNSYRIVIGSAGDINGNWRYDASYLYAAVSSTTSYVNDFFGPRVREAIGVDGPCVDDCIPYRVFQYEGVTPEAAAYVQGTGILNGYNAEKVFNAYITGDLPFTFPSATTPTALVFGVERREESFERVADEVFESALLLGQGGPTPSIIGSYNVKEVFTELSLPVVDSLDIELGARNSDYSTSGGESTYKIAVAWTPIDVLKLRGTYNRAIRAPNNAELYSPNSLGLWSGNDPCAGDFDNSTEVGEPEFSATQCALTGVTAAQYGNVLPSPASQYNGIFGGSELNPEVADTFTFGVVSNPMENFNFSVDYWSMKIDDAIDNIGAETIIRACVETADSAFCDLIHRGNGGTLWLGTSGYVTDTNVNLGQNTWQGIDVTARYRTDLGPGSLGVTLTGTELLKKETVPVPTVSETRVECAGIVSTTCFPSPKWRHTLTGVYAVGDWAATLRWRYYGGVDYEGATDTLLLGRGIASQSYMDVVGQYYISENLSFTMGINNLADREAPLVGGSLSTNANTIAGFYDMLGRMVFLNAIWRD